MFFVLSKLLLIFETPSDFALLLFAGAAFAFHRRRVVLAQHLFAGAMAIYVLFGLGPLGVWLARPLENRFPAPAPSPAPEGIVVLGGGIDPVTSLARHSFALSPAGARLTEAVILARRYPGAVIVYTGGSGNLLSDKIDEATTARNFWIAMGVAPSRILIEKASRNTYENALFTKRLVKPNGRWFLVTSALHMPRAIGVFREVGFAVTPDPVDYRTTGRASDWWTFETTASGGFTLSDDAVHEWLGLAVYRLTGRSTSLFPGPH